MRPTCRTGSAYALTDGFHARQGIVVAPDEQGQLACGDIVWAAAHRRVQDVDAAGAFRDGFGGARAASGVDEQDRAGRHAREQVALEAHLLDLLVGEHADDHQFGTIADIGQPGDGIGAEFADRLAFLVGSTQCPHVMTGVDEPADHGSAHAPGPDHADPRHRG